MHQFTDVGQKRPRCRHFGQCGVCTLQHFEYPQQLTLKTNESKSFISRTLHVDPVMVEECVPSPDEFSYLTSLDLISSLGDSQFTLGLPSQDLSTVLPIVRCELLSADAQGLPKSISGALRYLSNARDDLAVEMARIRTSSAGVIELSLWTHPGPFPRQIASATLVSATDCKGLKRVIFRGTPADEDIVVVEDLVSKTPWTTQVAGYRLQASAVSPIPPNAKVAEAMIERVLDLGWLGDRSRVLELYPGVGFFTIPLAKQVKSVTASEPFAFAYHDLVANLARTRSAAIPMPGSITRALPQVPGIDSIIVHADRVNLNTSDWKALAALGTSTLLLFAENHDGFGRSAPEITKIGFMPTEVIPFDLRPQTRDTALVARFLKR